MASRKGKDDDFLSNWLTSNRGRDPRKLSRNTVRSDRWDKADYEKILGEMRDLDTARARLCEIMEETGNGMTHDAWQSFFKVEPEPEDHRKIRPDYLINSLVRDEMWKLKEFDELRDLGTVGDDVNAALAFVTMREAIETCYDKLKKEAELLNKLMEQMSQSFDFSEMQRSIEDMMADLDDDDPEKGTLADRLAKLAKQQAANEKAIDKTAAAAQAGIDKAMPGIRTALQKGLNQAKDQADTMNSMSDSWGLEPGAWHKLPAEERIELAKRIKDRPKLQKLAKLIGRVTRLALSEQRRKIDYARSEIHNLEQGDDLARLVPDELIQMRHPVLKRNFRKNLRDKSLLQYKMRGEEKVGMGGIIFCEDGSGSMSGDREVWAKAVSIALLNVAKMQKRSFYGIHFGSPGQISIHDFSKPEDYTAEHIFDWAEMFCGGGTCFMTPLSVALKKLQEEHEEFGATKGDIVFCTDGQAGITDAFMEEFKAEQVRLNFQVFGVNVSGGGRDETGTEPLHTLCDSRVVGIRNLLSGEEMRDVFNGLNSP